MTAHGAGASPTSSDWCGPFAPRNFASKGAEESLTRVGDGENNVGDWLGTNPLGWVGLDLPSVRHPSDRKLLQWNWTFLYAMGVC